MLDQRRYPARSGSRITSWRIRETEFQDAWRSIGPRVLAVGGSPARSN